MARVRVEPVRASSSAIPVMPPEITRRTPPGSILQSSPLSFFGHRVDFTSTAGQLSQDVLITNFVYLERSLGGIAPSAPAIPVLQIPRATSASAAAILMFPSACKADARGQLDYNRSPAAKNFTAAQELARHAQQDRGRDVNHRHHVHEHGKRHVKRVPVAHDAPELVEIKHPPRRDRVALEHFLGLARDLRADGA